MMPQDNRNVGERFGHTVHTRVPGAAKLTAVVAVVIAVLCAALVTGATLSRRAAEQRALSLLK